MPCLFVDVTRYATLHHYQIDGKTNPGTHRYRGGTLVELSPVIIEEWARLDFKGVVRLEQEDDRPFTWVGVSVDPNG